ncbi:MAG: hypothetical protein Q9207_005040 [Kuettlingeria erythrocarpa]
MEANSLASDKVSLRIPRTIKHAMRFITSIGIRFLWVDRLCIVQDAPTNAEEINNMGYIYGNAYLTIVAAAGKDAEYGLPGLEGISFAKSKDFYYIPRSPVRDHTEDDPWRREQNHHALLQQATWNQRGWTLSELVSSPRVLCFHDYTITWECHCAVWHEDSTLNQVGDECLSRTPRPGYGFYQVLWPDLKVYSRLVREYTKREFSRVEDVTSAFAGITTTLSGSFSGGFIYGLPELYFDAALLWRLKRPFDYSQMENLDHAKTGLPSWSWQGWNLVESVPLDLTAWTSRFRHRTRTNHGQHTSWSFTRMRTNPTCQWHLQVSNGTRTVRTDISMYDSSVYDIFQTRRTGWQDKDDHFEHEWVPEIWFDFPVPLLRDPERVDLQEQSNLLNFRTEQVIFGPWEAVQGTDESGFDGTVVIQGVAEEAWVGVLERDVCPEWDVECETYYTLISISTGTIVITEEDDEFFVREWHYIRQHKPEVRNWEFYNVLWVTWKNDVAYRKGIGRIDKDAWERHNKDIVDITLG